MLLPFLFSFKTLPIKYLNNYNYTEIKIRERNPGGRIMMKIKLPYSRDAVEIEIPDYTDVIEPQFIARLEDPQTRIRESLQNPTESEKLSSFIKPESIIAVVHTDITRHTPNDILIPVITEELILAGAREENIVLINATGSHRAQTREELSEMLGEKTVKRFRCIQHDSHDSLSLKKIGTTDSGNDIYINREFAEADVRIITGFIEPHFFAGFSGGPKAVMPGLAGIETIMRNHSKENIASPLSGWGRLSGNPVWEEINQAASMASPSFMVNVALNSRHEITGVFSGAMKEAHGEGCRFVKNNSMVPVKKKYDIVITSNCGYPLDLNLYQTVKGISAAGQIVKNGGTIIIASECSEGMPDNSPFAKIISRHKSPADLMRDIMSSEKTEPEQWQAQILAEISDRAEIIICSERLKPNGSIFGVCSDISEEVAELLSKKPDSTICLLPQGPQTIPYIEEIKTSVHPAL